VPRVLILSTTTGYQLRSFADAAEQLGVELMFATDRCHTLDDPWRDAAVAVRFHEDEKSLRAILRAAAASPVDGLVAVGDRPVVLAARAAAALGLPGNPPDAAKASAHKRLARERLARAGLQVPWYVPLRTDEPLEPRAGTIRYPAVVKPVGLSGSRGVIRVDDERELGAAIERIRKLVSRPEIRAQRTGTERELLIEGFIPGQEFAIEGLLTRGAFTELAVFDKPDPLDGPFFEETIYVTPSAAPRRLRESIARAVEQAAQALGLWHGPIHAECRANGDGVFVIEVAARPIGGLCSRVLRFDTGGGPSGPAQEGGTCSLEHLLLRHAIGEDVRAVRREDASAAVMMIPIPRRGVFRSVSGEDEARAVRFVEDVRITAKPDQLLEPLPEAGSYLGFIFARAPRRDLAEAAVRDAHRRLVFAVDPAIEVRAVTA
jgi:biotin carboxylase